MPRSLKDDTADQIEETLWLTDGVLEAESDAKDFAAGILPWYVELGAARAGTREAARALVKKRGAASLRDGELDDGVDEFSDDLLRAVGKDRQHARYRRYFKVAVSRFKRIDRLTEATTVEGWKSSIAAEPEPAVAAHADPLGILATASREATQAVGAAEGERAGAKARVWDPFVAKLDAARAALHADLVKRGQERSKPRDWADRFFETESRRSVKVEGPAEPDKPAGS